MRWLDATTLFVTLLMCGTELTVSAFIYPAVWKHNSQAMAGEFARVMGKVMPVWYPLCLVLLGAEAYLRRQEPGHTFLFAAAILWAAVIVYTLTMLVPLNNRVASISEGAAVPDWVAISRKWDTLHRLRTALLLLAVALFYGGLQP